jgi:hypothetical protein
MKQALLAQIGAKICCSQLASHASVGKIRRKFLARLQSIQVRLSLLFSHIFAHFLTACVHRYFQPLERRKRLFRRPQSDKTLQRNGFTNTNPTPNTNSNPKPNPYPNPNLTLLQICF